MVGRYKHGPISTPQQPTGFLNGPFKADFNARFAKPARGSQTAWRPLPKGLDVDRICSFRYEATVGNDNALRLAGMILDIPAGPRRRGYARACVELRQLLDGRWRVYCKGQLLLETTPPIVQAPLTKNFTAPTSQDENCEKKKIANGITRNDRIKSRLTHVLRARDT